MTAYQQMGHHSENLINDPLLDGFGGAILSPVNYAKPEIADQIEHAPKNLDLIFDPQLYYPRTEREKLKSWSYFPSDVDTADPSSDGWWHCIVNELAMACENIHPTSICSPAVVPHVYNNEYYTQMRVVGSWLAKAISGSNIRPIQTAIVNVADLTAPDRPLEIASILSGGSIEAVYLVIVSSIDPRRELNDTEELKGVMRLIAALARSGLDVIVGFTSTDMVLWKAAGATACASGKFFNLRRFTSSRFE